MYEKWLMTFSLENEKKITYVNKAYLFYIFILCT